MKKNRAKSRGRFIFVVSIPILVLMFLTYNIFEFVRPNQTVPINNDFEQTLIPKTDATSTESPIIESPIAEIPFDYLSEGGMLELPVNGASGYASISLRLHEGPGTETTVMATLDPGTGFTILDESNEWWEIETKEGIGWVMHKYCFINLPDVIPSIIYNNTNAYSSKMMSSGKSIPNITGLKLYDAYSYNERLGKYEYVLPVLYAMALKINVGQQAALADGNTLIIYEGFRPHAVQRKIVTNLSDLVNSDPSVKKGVIDSQWSMRWFISTGISNHQKGLAIDVSLGKVIQKERKISGAFTYTNIVEYKEYTMPSQIHELSIASIVFKTLVSSTSGAWKDATMSDTMNHEARLLQQYCTDAGLTPLASEWWHFDDLSLAELLKNVHSDGKYFIEANHSKVPNAKMNRP